MELLLELLPRQAGEEAGLVVSGQKTVKLGLSHDGTENRVVLRTDDGLQILAQTAAKTLRLRLEMQAGGRCSFAFASAGAFTSVPQTLQAHKWVWIGAKVGLYSIKQVQDSAAGHVDVDYFRFS